MSQYAITAQMEYKKPLTGTGYFLVIDNLFAIFFLFVAKHDSLSFDILRYSLNYFWN